VGFFHSAGIKREVLALCFLPALQRGDARLHRPVARSRQQTEPVWLELALQAPLPQPLEPGRQQQGLIQPLSADARLQGDGDALHVDRSARDRCC
jgi:hypothetical protein